MKKFLSLAAVASMALAANAAETTNYVEKWGKLKLVDNQLSSSSKEAIQLKGWSTALIHSNDVNGCLNSENWNLMHQYGANVVRLAISVQGDGAYLSDPHSWKARVKDYIKEINDEGMYVLLDWHIESDTLGKNSAGDPSLYTKEALDFFSEISKYCAENELYNVLYELCNEPTTEWSEIKDYAEKVIPQIVRNQKDAIIIVGTPSWCQNIMEPLTAPINASYRLNVMYSFHYYACSHYALLGEFREAQKSMPVFVSQWSAVQFNGAGPLCMDNGDALILDCMVDANAPQLVSWCMWNWGHGDEASATFSKQCDTNHLTKADDSTGKGQVGEYAVSLMTGGFNICPCRPDTGAYQVQDIPNTESNAWMWAYFDLGGEGTAYHDINSSAYMKDASTGEYLDYAIGVECDAYSLANKLGLLDKKNPWYTLSVDGKNIDEYSDSVKCTTWDGKESYLSLNAGKKYDGVSGSGRPDEGVDLAAASLLGTPLEYKNYNNLCSVEAGEWIKYTVDVAEPGYYKVEAYVSGECEQGGISFYQNRGNITRSTTDIYNKEDYTVVHFEKPNTCADSKVNRSTAPWDCWDLMPAIDSDDEPNAVIVFVKAGEQELGVMFSGPANGVGPLVFTKLDYESVETVDADKTGEFTIVPNPTTGDFTVTLSDGGKAHVDVINVAGQVVYSAEFENVANINKILAAGIYSVVVKSNSGIKAEKLIVK